MLDLSNREPICLAEERRLIALYALYRMDAPGDPLLQAIVVHAAALFDAPIGCIALVDRNHQMFIARLGIDMMQTNRSWSFSTHAIQNAGPYEIVDPARHDIFAANPLVLGAPHVRYYCAAPLQLANGRRVGTLSVVDDRQRPAATPQQRAALSVLAAEAVDRLTTLAAEARPRDTDDRDCMVQARRRQPAHAHPGFASLCGSLIAA